MSVYFGGFTFTNTINVTGIVLGVAGIRVVEANHNGLAGGDTHITRFKWFCAFKCLFRL
jgi:hypothetical protein